MSTPRVLFGTLILFFSAALHGCDANANPDLGSDTLVFVGSGGCDGQDTHCKDRPADEKEITLLTINKEGELAMRHQERSLPGQAAWFAVKQWDEQYCLFVTYPDISSIGVWSGQ